MTTTQTPGRRAGDPPVDKLRPAPKRTSTWRVAAWDRWLQLEADTSRSQPIPARAVAQLDRAHQAFEDDSLTSWWTGSSEEEVQGALDLVEQELVPADAAARKVLAQALRARITRRFRAGDSRRTAALELLGRDPSADQLREALELLHAGSFDLRATQRARRNTTLVASTLFAAAGVVLAAAIQRDLAGLSLAKVIPVPEGASVPNAWAVLLMGAIGGLLSVGLALFRVGRPTRAGAAFLVQVGLKASLGALVALIASLAVQRGVLPVVDPQDPWTLLVWALLFGYSQEVITKRLDERLASTQPPTSGAGGDEA